MGVRLEQIEHFEHFWAQKSDKPWRNLSYSRKWLKKQMNKFLRRKNKKISQDDIGYKQGRKPFCGYEY